MEAFFFFLTIAVLIGGFFIMNEKALSAYEQMEKRINEKPLSNQDIVDLISGRKKPRVYYDGSVIAVDREEAVYSMYRHQYKISKMFELASLQKDGQLEMGDGSIIAPQSKEHGLSSGNHANALRKNILEKYGVDLAKLD